LSSSFGRSTGIFVSATTPIPKIKISDYNNTKEIVTFINFSDEIIQLYWVDTNTGEEFPAAVARPYQLTTSQTFSGHVFAYRWGHAKFTHIVDETNTIPNVVDLLPKEDEEKEKEDGEDNKDGDEEEEKKKRR